MAGRNRHLQDPAEQDPTESYNNRDFDQYKHGGEVRRQWRVNAGGGWGADVEEGASAKPWSGSRTGDKFWSKVNKKIKMLESSIQFQHV